MKNPLQAHSANNKYNINLNPLLHKELAKIKSEISTSFSSAHLQLEIRKLQMSLLDLNQVYVDYIDTINIKL